MKAVKKSVVCLAACLCLAVFGAWTTVPATFAAAEDSDAVRYAEVDMVAAYANETVTYTNRVVTENTTVNNVPKYSQVSGLTNACGAVAGSIIVGFYDRYFPDLIPDWDSYFPNGKYRGQDTAHVDPLMRTLYTSMRTNVDDVGVSRYDFLAGLQSYINNKGLSIVYNQVATSTTLNYDACKVAIDANRPIVIFARAGDVYLVGAAGDGTDLITPVNISSNHIMVVFGYRIIEYYNANGLFRTDKYLLAMTGFSAVTEVCYKISPHNLDLACSVTIKE